MNDPVSIWSCFSSLRDPRTSRREKKHRLLDIVAIALCATIAGANDWPQVVAFAQQRQEWLSTFLSLSHGIPSRSTFERVFAALSPRGLQHGLYLWLHACNRELDLKHISIDGKTLCGSGNASEDLANLHIVSAWAQEAGLSLGQIAVEAKSNEITAIPRLLRMLDLKGALVTIDAMGCQKAIAQQIVEGGGDYVLPVKENQPNLHADILESMIEAQEHDFEGWEHDRYQSEEQGHGRWERRTVTVLYDTSKIRDQEVWEKLSVIGMCFRERRVGDKTSEELSLFIGSRRTSAEVYAKGLRDHWGIENQLHWQLDVTFGEDGSRIQDRKGAENMALLRKWALSLLKQHPDKAGMATKQYKAALNPQYLQEILQG